jgi:signal recognition particle subunit SRP54
MVLEKLSSVLKKATDKIANAVFLDKKMVDGIVKDLQRALIEADVNVKLVLEITGKIKKAALDERIKGVEKKEHLVKLLHEELVGILGAKKEIKLKKKNVFLMVGLYGSGKTTTISKLAAYYGKRGSKVCAVGLDVHRPAAPEQLKQLCDKLKIKAFIDKKEKDPKKIWKKYVKEIKKYNLVLVDSAGRDSLDKALIKEIKDVVKMVKPTERILIIPADIGQAAKKQAQAFKEAVDVTGVIVTRMDSTAKGGGALTACAEVKSPVVFIGTGEKPADLETFDPDSFLSRLLGMGDLPALMEKIRSVVDKKQIEKTQKALEKGKFTMKEFEAQLESMESLGSFSKIMSLVPGLGKMKEKVSESQLEAQKGKVKKWKAAIKSMTPYEIENPEILEKETSRIQRIAKGSGASTSDIRALIKQYKMIKEMIKSQSDIAKGKIDKKMMMKLAKKFGKKMRF